MRKAAIELLMRHPAKAARLCGLTRLTDELHGAWLEEMICGTEDFTLLAHRGSCKTTCLAFAMAAMLLVYPQRNILFMRNAAYRLALDAEQYILSVIKEDAGTKQTITGSLSDPDGVYFMILQFKLLLDQNNVPRLNRKLIVPPFVETTLLMDPRFVTGSAEAADRLENGAVARACGFDIYISPDLTDEIIAMIPEAVTFANQITKVDAYRPEKGFCDGVKGLCLSGAKVIIPEAVMYFKITQE